MEPLLSNSTSFKQMDLLATQALLQHGDQNLIMKQVALSPPGTFQGKSGTRHFDTIEEVVRLLPTVDKIAALIRSVGLFKACQLLPLLPEKSCFNDHFENINDFLFKLQDQMGGVVDCSGLSSLRVIRMLLFAMAHKWQRDMENDKDYTLGVVKSSRAGKDSSPAELPKSLQKELDNIFLQLDIMHESQSMPQLQGHLRNATIYCENYKELWEHNPDRRRRAEEAKAMLRLLELLTKASEHFWLYTPLLQSSVTVEACEIPNADDRRLETWLQSFLNGFRTQSAAVMSLIKLHLPKKIVLKADQELEVLDKSVELAVSKASLASMELRQFACLSPTAQHSQTAQLSRINLIRDEALQHLADSVKQYETCVVGEIGKLLKKLKGKWHKDVALEDWVRQKAKSNLQHPWHYLRIFIDAVLDNVRQGHLAISQVHEQLESQLPAKYRNLAHIRPIDMLEFDLVSAYLEWACDPQLDKNQKEALKNFYDQYMNLIDALRSESEIDYGRIIQPLLDACGNVNVADPNFNRLNKAANILSLISTEGRGLKLLFNNPFAGAKEDAQKEMLFYCDLAMLQRRRFLSQEVLQLIEEIKLSDLKDDKVAPQVRIMVDQLSSSILKAQAALKSRVTVTPANFMEETRFLWDKIVSCGAALEEGVVQLEFLLQQKNQPKLAKQLSMLKSRYQRDFFSLGRSLYQKFQEREWIKTEEKNRHLREERRQRRAALIRHKFVKPEIAAKVEPTAPKPTTPAPQAPPPQVPQADSLEGSLLAFETICRECLPLFRFFEQTSTNPEEVKRTQLQHQSATNLLESLPILRELTHGMKKHGANSYFAQLLHLKLAVLLEQASILTASTLNIYSAPGKSGHDLFQNQGRECFWERHSPIQLAKLIATHLLRVKMEMLLSKEKLALLQGFDRTIAVTSRKPHSGGDALTHMLQILDHEETDIEKCRQELETTFKLSLQTVSTLLKPVYRSDPDPSPEPSLSADAIRACLAAPKESEGLSHEEVDSILNSFDERIHRLQQRLAVPAQRRVPAIHRNDESVAKRAGTIWSALNDLAASLKLSRKLINEAEDPALCLATAESSLLNHASILEGALLIVLSHLPCRAAPGSPQHYLWQENGKRPLRYRHAVESFAKVLPDFLEQARVKREMELYQNTITCAENLGGYLRSAYRYYDENKCQAADLRDKFKHLSILRHRITDDNLSSSDVRLVDDCLGIREPASRLERLDQHIAHLIRQEIKLPALRLLELADEWLEVYEEMARGIRRNG